jgi:hypothetical protein
MARADAAPRGMGRIDVTHGIYSVSGLTSAGAGMETGSGETRYSNKQEGSLSHLGRIIIRP